MIGAVRTAARNLWGAAVMFTAALSASPLPAQNRVTVSGMDRSYRIGDTTVSERIATIRYDLFLPRTRVRIDGSVLRYSSPSAAIGGHLPVAVRIDFANRPGDTITVFGRTASNPFDLTPIQTAALSPAGTATIDLQSTALGTPAVGGGRAVFSFPLGDAVVALRGGLEVEARPASTRPVYWRGATLRGGFALTSGIGDGSITGSVEATRSSADSLGGRNLFPGGGNVIAQLVADASVLDPFDELADRQWPVRAVVFYSRPFDNARSDQPNLIIPQGSLYGALATVLIPVRSVTLLPSFQLLRESSTSVSQSGLVRTEYAGHAFTMEAALDLAIPFGSVFEITPQAGYAFGSVGATSSNAVSVRRGRGLVRSSSFSDAVRGSWFGVQLTADF